MKVQYVTDDGKVFDEAEECLKYEATPTVYIITATSVAGSYNIIEGVYLTPESAEAAKDLLNKTSYNFIYRITNKKLSSNYGIKNVPICKTLADKFKTFFNID
jgi:hypothetical protein